MTNAPNAARPPTDSSVVTRSAAPRGASAAAAILAVVSFALHLALALRLDAAAALEQQDVFFHADTRARLECAVDGSCAGRSSVSHPNLAVFVNPPVQAAAAIAAGQDASTASVRQLRHRYALLVSPIGAALQGVLAFALMLELGLAVGPALLVAVLGSLSFSSLIFGSIPETFAWSAAFITAAMWLAARRSRPPLWCWYALAFVATGITVTNLVPIGILLAVSHARRGEVVATAVARTGIFALSVSLATLAVALATANVYESRELGVADGQRYVSKWMEGNDPVVRGLRFPGELANTLVAVEPARVQSYQGIIHDARYKFRFTLDGTTGISTTRPLTLVAALLVVFGTFILLRGTPAQRGLAVASLAILLFNGVLHAFWGVGPFLYSQHWLPPLVLLSVGGLFADGRLRAVALGVIAVFTGLSALQNLAVLDGMLAWLTIGGLWTA